MDTASADVEVVRDNVKEMRDAVVKHVQGTASRIGEVEDQVAALSERVGMMEKSGDFGSLA
jgi:hypothetical protein